VLIRDEEWLVRSSLPVATGGYAVRVVCMSELVRNQGRSFLTVLDDIQEMRAEQILPDEPQNEGFLDLLMGSEAVPSADRGSWRCRGPAEKGSAPGGRPPSCAAGTRAGVGSTEVLRGSGGKVPLYSTGDRVVTEDCLPFVPSSRTFLPDRNFLRGGTRAVVARIVAGIGGHIPSG
jgi:hypothetical protein